MQIRSFKKAMTFVPIIALAACMSVPAQLITPNPLISRGKPIFGNPAYFANLNNGKFREIWNAGSGAWAAINVGAGPTKVFFTWNNPNGTWNDNVSTSIYCTKQNPAFMSAYEILTSANSTNGTDGQWTTVLTITGNDVTARGHLINFTGMSWIKLHVTTGGGTLDEIEVFDATNGTKDTWFFPGTSISAMTYKNALPLNGKNFADLVTAAHPGCNPAMVRAGIGCINSVDMANNISKYIAMGGNTHYWAIEMGTNDGWGGYTTGLDAFRTSMQTIITACKNAGIVPIIAQVIAVNTAKTTSPTGWQIDQGFRTAVTQLTASNNIPTGPDLYTYFLAHPNYLQADGVHPNDSGCAAIQKLWADKMSSLYPVTSTVRPSQANAALKNGMTISTTGNRIDCQSKIAGTVSIFSAKGALLSRTTTNHKTVSWIAPSKGIYLVEFATSLGPQSAKVLIR